MLNRQIVIVNRLGLHARAAARFVQTAASFPCEVTIVKGGSKINGKSIMGLMMLAASQGTELDICTDGTDEEAAMKALVDLIDARFGEPE